MKGIKAFKKDMTCRGFQYEENKTYTMNGDPSTCRRGYHFCENPLDVLNYYDLTDCVFAKVEALGKTNSDSDDSKVATNQIKIGMKIGLPGFVEASFEYLKSLADTAHIDEVDESIIADEKYFSQVATSGDFSKVATSGDSSQVATSGYSSQVATSGDFSKVATSGDFSKVATSGDFSKVATSGYFSQVATSGDFSKVATSGDSSQVATSGDFSKVATSGDSSQVESTGEKSVIANIGHNGKVKAALNSWITLAEYDCKGHVICVKSAKIDGDSLKPDVWYKLLGGEFIEI